MERVKFALRLIGILTIPVIILVGSSVIWQNRDLNIDRFSLIGGWWELEAVRLSSLLICFLLVGVLLLLGLIFLILSERKILRERAELQKIKKHNTQISTGKNKVAEQGQEGQKKRPATPVSKKSPDE